MNHPLFLKLRLDACIWGFTLLISSLILLPNSTLGQPDSLVSTIQDIAWSPDGRYIFFSGMRHRPDYSDYQPSNWSIYRFDTENQQTKKLIEQAIYVSPSNSGKLAASVYRDGQRDIMIFDKEGKAFGKLTTHPADDFAPSWSPDGKYLCFNSRRTGSVEIYIAPTNGKWIKPVTSDFPHNSYNPQWSPDGTQILYYLEKGDSRDQIMVHKLKESQTINLSNDTYLNYFPSWIDNEKILYTRDGDDIPAQIMTMNLEDKIPDSMKNILSYYARTSPDGQLIAFVDQSSRAIQVKDLNENILYQVFLPHGE